jgi:transcriptional regulator with GAF, ATPase, and Fis domain
MANQDKINPKGYQALYELSRQLLACEDFDEMLDAAVMQTLSMLEAERGFLVLVRGDDFVFQVVKNWSPEEYEEQRAPISRSVLREVIANKEPTLIEDASNDKRFQKTASVVEMSIRSVLAAPLFADNAPLGVLYLESRSTQRFFDETDLALFQGILELTSRVISASLKRIALAQRNAALESDFLSRYQFQGIITKDDRFLRVLETVAQIAPSNLPVLVQGASGTGKELIAKALHLNSPRSKRPFLIVNCSAISPNLLESELFGYIKGSFTGARANKIGIIPAAHQGTLFLDEIGELPKELQAKLLRAVQFGEVTPVGATQPQVFDVRFVAATNRDLSLEVKEGRFREDLFYRLNTITLQLPTLKDRPGDILPLFHHFIANAAKVAGRRLPEISAKLEHLLESYEWPGNIRELEGEARRLFAITPEGLPLSVERLSPRLLQNVAAPIRLRKLEEQERELITLHLQKANGNRTIAAETLGVTREGLRLMMRRHNLLETAQSIGDGRGTLARRRQLKDTKGTT